MKNKVTEVRWAELITNPDLPVFPNTRVMPEVAEKGGKIIMIHAMTQVVVLDKDENSYAVQLRMMWQVDPKVKYPSQEYNKHYRNFVYEVSSEAQRLMRNEFKVGNYLGPHAVGFVKIVEK